MSGRLPVHEMGSSRALRREIKFDVDLGARAPDLDGLPDGLVARGLAPVVLEATYFDGRDLRLLRRGVTLQQRGEVPAVGGRRGSGHWMLELGTDLGGGSHDRSDTTARNRVFSPDGARSVPPADLLALVQGLLRFEPLEKVVETSILRRRWALEDAKGGHLADIADDTTTVRGGPRDGATFRQIELEPAGRFESVMGLVRDRIEAGGAAKIRCEPELCLALGLDRGAPREWRVLTPARKSRLGQVVGASISGALERLLDNDVPIRLGGDDREPVRQARVATRRLRSDLETFSCVLDPVWVAHVREDLEWLGGALGAVRDLDVLGERLEPSIDAASSLEATSGDELVGRLRSHRRDAAADLGEVLSSRRYLELLDRVDSAARRPPFSVAGDGGTGGRSGPRANDHASVALGPLLRKRWRRLRRAVRDAGESPTDDQLHRIRIKARQLRYAAEAATPVHGEPAGRLASSAEELQGVLGDHHDAVGVEQWLRFEALQATVPVAFIAGQLLADARREQAELRDKWRGVWAGLDDRQVHRFIRSPSSG